MKLKVSLVLIILLLSISFSFADDSGIKANKPNILFIAIDDLRPEIGCYGNTQAKTPNIDKLAAQGMVFSRAYCQVPVCGASRASLMTGIWPSKKRFVSYNTKAEVDTPDAVTLAQAFKDAGYTTISNGKIFHHADDTNDKSWSEPAWHPSGVDHMTSFDPATTKSLSSKGRGFIYECIDIPDNAYGDGKVAEKTISDLQRLKKNGKPFFLACGFIRPHLPFYAPKKYWDMYERDKIKIAENRSRPENAPTALRGSGEYKSYGLGDYNVKSDRFHKMMRHGYWACLSYADKLVGDVLAELKNLGLEENTIVVIWGDHGWHLGEHDFWGKHNTMHNSLRVPLIISVPGVTKGQQCNSLVELVDIYPTLCDLAGLHVAESVNGNSFRELFANPQKEFHKYIYSRFKIADAVVTDSFAYTMFENGEQMLFDHSNDPQENVNVASEAKYSNKVDELNNYLKTCMQRAK